MGIDIVEIIKAIFLGIVEGITEWLPISSTGHMLLVDEFIHLNMSEEFKKMFFIVIQLGAILAVVLLFWNKMFPFQFKDKNKPIVQKDIFTMWFKVVVACIPGAIVTLLFDDYVDAHLHTPFVIALALIFYGIAFIIIGIVAVLGFWLYNDQVVASHIRGAGFVNMFKDCNLKCIGITTGGYLLVSLILMFCFRHSKFGSILGRIKK